MGLKVDGIIPILELFGKCLRTETPSAILIKRLPVANFPNLGNKIYDVIPKYQNG